MSSNPDPEEQPVTGLEEGGGVPPGETPPGEASIASDIGHQEKPDSSFNWGYLVIGILAVLVVLVLIFIIGSSAGIFDIGAVFAVTPFIMSLL